MTDWPVLSDARRAGVDTLQPWADHRQRLSEYLTELDPNEAIAVIRHIVVSEGPAGAMLFRSSPLREHLLRCAPEINRIQQERNRSPLEIPRTEKSIGRLRVVHDRYVWIHAKGNRGTVTHAVFHDPMRGETNYETRHRRKISRSRSVSRMPKWLKAALARERQSWFSGNALDSDMHRRQRELSQ